MKKILLIAITASVVMGIGDLTFRYITGGFKPVSVTWYDLLHIMITAILLLLALGIGLFFHILFSVHSRLQKLVMSNRKARQAFIAYITTHQNLWSLSLEETDTPYRFTIPEGDMVLDYYLTFYGPLSVREFYFMELYNAVKSAK